MQFHRHLFTKLQFFNLAAHLICKVEDWFLLLLFVNSGASLIPTIDVHKADWEKEITWKAINEGLRLRKSERFCGRFRKSNRYLDALADEDYRTIRSVCRKLGRPRSVGIIREYRNEIAHRGLPAVDYPFFSPQFQFPKTEGQGAVLRIGGGADVLALLRGVGAVHLRSPDTRATEDRRRFGESASDAGSNPGQVFSDHRPSGAVALDLAKLQGLKLVELVPDNRGVEQYRLTAR